MTFAYLIAALLAQAPEAVTATNLAAGTVAATAAPAELNDGDDQEQVCRSVSDQRAGLITRSRKLCLTREQWKQRAARSG